MTEFLAVIIGVYIGYLLSSVMTGAREADLEQEIDFQKLILKQQENLIDEMTLDIKA